MAVHVVFTTVCSIRNAIDKGTVVTGKVLAKQQMEYAYVRPVVLVCGTKTKCCRSVNFNIEKTRLKIFTRGEIPKFL